MNETLEILSLMRWPLLACLLLPWLLVYLGLHIVERQVIFVDLALAQIASLGSCLGLLCGYDPHDWQNYALSLGFTFVGAVMLTFTRKLDHRVPQEALIGILYVVAAAAGVLVLNRTTGGQEELQRSLVGELLTVTRREILQTIALFALVGVVHFVFRRKFQAISLDPVKAAADGVSVIAWDFLFYILFGLVVTSFVHIGGVLLVFSYLIIPAVCAVFLAKSFKMRFLVGWLVATLASGASLVVTARKDLPLGAAIVCGLGISLVLVMIYSALRRRFAGAPALDSTQGR
ncbi:MAG: iron chelate uptake ABC transporter family permease subunit [Verrucomicrobiota bacterium]